MMHEALTALRLHLDSWKCNNSSFYHNLEYLKLCWVCSYKRFPENIFPTSNINEYKKPNSLNPINDRRKKSPLI